MHTVAKSGNINNVQALLNIGFKSDVVTTQTHLSKKYNFTPIHVAIENKDAELLHLLLKSKDCDSSMRIKAKDKDRSEEPMKHAIRIARESIEPKNKDDAKKRKAKKRDRQQTEINPFLVKG